TSHHPLAKIHRIASAHDPPPQTVNHASANPQTSDSHFRSDALAVQKSQANRNSSRRRLLNI
ncbi:hypothetical protein, partial [Afifella marina]|uniref:hypothetical protein n=1 Tax=Afifella marina TaxID=1080 RepID=UPI001A91D745